MTISIKAVLGFVLATLSLSACGGGASVEGVRAGIVDGVAYLNVDCADPSNGLRCAASIEEVRLSHHLKATSKGGEWLEKMNGVSLDTVLPPKTRVVIGTRDEVERFAGVVLP